MKTLKITVFTKCLSALIIGILLGIILIQSASASIFSAAINFAAGNKTYRARSEVALSLHLSSNRYVAYGIGHINPTDNSNVPIGYIGARGRLFRYNGNNSHTLIEESNLRFNTKATNAFEAGIDAWATNGWTYNANGTVEAWNPQTGRYVVQNANRTRNLSN